MKARLFTASAFLMSVALLALLVPGGASLTVAQVRPVAAAPDHAQVTAALQSAPVMFIKNVGQFPAPAGGTGADGARLQVRGMSGGLTNCASRAAPTPDAGNVEFVGHIGGATYAVALQGNYAYIGEGPRLTILDISNPASPTVLGKTLPLPDTVRRVAVAGSYAYVADYDGGLRVVDVSTPSNPMEVGFYDTPGDAYGVAVAGDYAYVTGVSGYPNWDGWLRVVDVSDPTNPTEVGACDTPDETGGVAVAGGYAYVTDWDGGLRVVDVSTPSNPTEVGFYDTPGYAGDVAVAGGYAYVVGRSGYPPYDGWLRVVDVSDPINPTEAGFYDTPGRAWGVAIAGGYAYVADHYKGLRVVDVSDPTNPTEAGFYDTPGYAQGVAIAGDYAYVADCYKGLRVADVSTPSNPTEVGFYETPGNALGVAVAGSYAYVADGKAGLRVVDVSTPTNPRQVGFYDTPGSAYSVAVAGDYAYVADYGRGLRVVDVSDQTNPTEVGACDTPGYAWGVAVAGGYAYVADGDAGLRVVDVASPANPTEVGFHDTLWSARGVAVAGDYAYVADGDGLRVVDISTPSNPTQVGACHMPWSARGVAVAGGYAYVADCAALRVVDVSTPSNPTEVGFYDTPGYASSVTVAGGYAYVADNNAGLRVVDISTPSNPTEVGFYDTPGAAWDVAVAGDYAYVADCAGGLLILRFTGRAPTELTEAVQNMATNTNTRLDQVLAEANEIAQDGDYFAVQKTEHEIDLIADAIVDSAGILADGFDTVLKVKDLFKVAFPGVTAREWGHIRSLTALHEEAHNLFRDALQQEVTVANARQAAKELFSGAHIYYGAAALNTAAGGLGYEMVKDGWKACLHSELALQSELYPAQQEIVDIFKQDVTDTRDETIANMPSLTPEEEQAYIEDLTQRDKADIVMAFTLERRALPLHLARDDQESGQGSWIANFLAKYLIKRLAFLYADGPGVLAVDVGSAFWDLYQNSRQLNQDLQMMNLAVEGIGGSLEAEKRIYLNTAHGMDNIVQGIEPQIARGSISSIANKSEGEYRLFGSWWWCERSSYSEVNVSNSASYDTVYQVIADYGKTGFLGTSYQPLVGEGVRAIPGGGSDTVHVYYKRDDEGASPDEGSAIKMDLLGSTDTGTYHVTHDGTTWTPTRVTASSVFQITTQAQAEAPTIPYPIRTRMTVDEDALTYTPYIWVDNPFTQTVMVTLTQPLPADVQVIDTNGSSVVENSLRWQRIISPQATVEITHLIRYLGDAGQEVHYPEPQMEMTDLEATAYVTFTGEAETFISQPPLSAVGTPPAEIMQGESVTIPITVTNRLADEAASGTVRLSLIDFEAETEVYSDTQDVSVPAGGSQVVELRLYTASVAGGDYLLMAVVESSGGQEEAFAEYLRVRLYFYLPLILRNG